MAILDKPIIKTNGPYKVKLHSPTWSGIELLMMVNGNQWTGQPINIEVLKLLWEAIDEVLEVRAQPEKVPK